MTYNPKIVIETHAYNASSTLERTIKSILSQTYQNWEWHLYENGSTDDGATLEIIKKYAATDSRIRSYQNIYNFPKNTYVFLGSHSMLSEHKDDYFSYICADDTWEPDYLSSMLNFLVENNLDIASCTSKYINSETGACLNKFFLQENVFVENPEEYSEKFNILYPFYRELWGHLIPFSTLQRLSPDNYFRALSEPRYSFLKLNLQLLLNTDRIGIYAKPLHDYYVSSKGIAHNPLLRDSRLDHFKSICYLLRSFLISKCGYISRDNEKFILERYLKTIYDYLPVMFENDDYIKQILFIRDIVKFDDTQTAFESPLVSSELKSNYADKVMLWIRDGVQNKKFEQQFVVGNKEGHFQHFVQAGSLNSLSYNCYDVYNINRNYATYRKKSELFGIVNSMLGIIIEFQEFFIKYSTIED